MEPGLGYILGGVYMRGSRTGVLVRKGMIILDYLKWVVDYYSGSDKDSLLIIEGLVRFLEGEYRERLFIRTEFRYNINQYSVIDGSRNEMDF